MPEAARQLAEVPHFQNEIDADFLRLIDEFDSHPDWFWVRQITDEIGTNGCQKVAAFIGVTDRAVRQWREDPVRGSGVVSPIARCMTFLSFVTTFDNPKINLIVRHFLKPALEHMRLEMVDVDKLAGLKRAVGALIPDQDKQLGETTTLCPRCSEAPLEYVPGPNIWHCRICGGK